MDQKIRDKEYRIVFILTYAQDHGLSAFLYDHAVNSQRERHILILLDAPVIMSVQICDIAVFIEGILLDVEPGGINMRADNIEAFLDRRPADLKHDHGFVHPHTVDPVTGLQFSAFPAHLIEFHISVGFRVVHKTVHAFALRLAAAQKLLIVFREIHT